MGVTGEGNAGEAPSSKAGGASYLLVGRVRAPKGVHGELKVGVQIEDAEHLETLREVYLGDDHVRFEVRRARLVPGQLLLQLSGIDERDAAAQWAGTPVYVRKEALPLGEDEYYYHQIEGLTALTVEGETLGQVVEVLPTGANDVYVVQGSKGELLLPAIKQVILRVDPGAGVMVVKLPDGLR